MLSSILQGWYGHCKDKSSEIFFPKHDQRENFYILYSVSHIPYSIFHILKPLLQKWQQSNKKKFSLIFLINYICASIIMHSH